MFVIKMENLLDDILEARFLVGGHPEKHETFIASPRNALLGGSP